MWCYTRIIRLAPFISVAVAAQTHVRDVDVAIIGGGVSGTYAAVRLYDQQKSIALIEPQDHLGGNTETYVDPTTNTPVEIGVQLFANSSTVRDYYDRFQIPLAKADAFAAGPTKYLDFDTGETVPNPATASTPQEQAAGFAAYAKQRGKYPYLYSGYHLPDPIPPDLLLPFGAFVQKYSLTATLPIISLFTEGFGDISTIPSLYVLRYFDADFFDNFSQKKYITTAAHNNSLLYSAAESLLGPSVFLRSRVVATSRPTEGPAILSVSTPTGLETIRAKRILVAFPQLLSNFAGWDIDDQENAVFSRFNSAGLYTGLLRNTGIPANLALQNAGAHTSFNLPSLPGIYNIGPSPVPDLLHVYYGVIANSSLKDVETAILASLDRLRRSGAIPDEGEVQVPILRSHTPYELQVTVPDIQARFYDRLYALQGHRGTYYTGAAFQRHDASLLWEYTAAVLKNLTVGL